MRATLLTILLAASCVSSGEVMIQKFSPLKYFNGPKNHALWKQASQSSTLVHLGRPLSPKFSVDGVRNPIAGVLECSHTNGETNPWWRVDLGEPVTVKRIIIQNRIDCCGDRLQKLHVTVGHCTSHMESCTTYSGPGYNGQSLMLVCDRPVTGRYVQIQLNYHAYLTMCEVEVYSV